MMGLNSQFYLFEGLGINSPSSRPRRPAYVERGRLPIRS